MIPRPATILRCAIRPFFSFIRTLARLLGPGSVRSIVGKSLLKDHLLNVIHFRQRCVKARPDTPISLYYANHFCFIALKWCELPAFWFVGKQSKTLSAVWCRLQRDAPFISPLNWTEVGLK